MGQEAQGGGSDPVSRSTAVIAALRARTHALDVEHRLAARRLASIEGHGADLSQPVPARIVTFLAENTWTTWTPAEIMAAVRGGSEAVRKALQRLVADGRVVRSGHAAYGVPR